MWWKPEDAERLYQILSAASDNEALQFAQVWGDRLLEQGRVSAAALMPMKVAMRTGMEMYWMDEAVYQSMSEAPTQFAAWLVSFRSTWRVLHGGHEYEMWRSLGGNKNTWVQSQAGAYAESARAAQLKLEHLSLLLGELQAGRIPAAVGTGTIMSEAAKWKRVFSMQWTLQPPLAQRRPRRRAADSVFLFGAHVSIMVTGRTNSWFATYTAPEYPYTYMRCANMLTPGIGVPAFLRQPPVNAT